MTEETLFELARKTPEAERAAFLDRACEGKPELRARVEALLAADAASSPLSKPSPTIEASTGFQATASFTSPEPSPGIVIAGRYTLEQKLGEGGMGEVWVAKQSKPVKRKVALKLIKAGMDSKSVVQRFEQERQALAMMDHPNIARVLDGGITENRQPFFVMELVNGLSLNKFCDEAKLGINERLELFVPICQAVQHAHQKGIVHRDLKPANILVTMIDGKPVPKVIDFGVAKATGGKLTDESMSTQFGAIIGTLEYMSPEQAGFSNQDVDTRADIYSLGVILYELLTGLRPFDSKRLKQVALDEVIRIIREEEPSKPSTRLSTAESLPSLAAVRHIEPAKLTALLRGELDWVVMKCLEKQRDRRYETANGLVRDIQRYLSDEAVEARPPNTGYRLKKFIIRNRGKLLATSLVFLALVAGIAGTTWGLIEANYQTGQARQETRAKDQALIQTQKRLTQIGKGVELFSGLLSGISPRSEEKEGKPLYEQLRVRAVKAADQLESEAVADEVAEARLQSTLGNTLRELGSYSKAIEVLEKARSMQEKKLEANHSDTIRTLAYLAAAYAAVGRRGEAIALFEKVRDIQLKTSPNDPDTLGNLSSLANEYRGVGRTVEAIQLLETVREAMVKNLGPEHADTLLCLNNLALAYSDARRISEAIPLYEQVRDAQVKHLGLEHLSTLTTLGNLADSYRDAGRPADAIPVLQQARGALEKKLGADHPDSLANLNILAATYWSLNQLDQSIPLFKDILARREKKLGRQHPDTLVSIANLGVNYKDAGRLAEAIPLLEEAYSAAQKHPSLRSMGTQLQEGYVKAGKFIEATRLTNELVVDARKRLPKESLQLARQLALLGLAFVDLKRNDDAEPLIRESLAIRQKIEPDNWITFNTQSMLGRVLLHQKKYLEAEPLLLKGYEGMKQREKTIPPLGSKRLPEALDRLIQLYTETNKPDEVKKWQAEREKYPKLPEKK
ncbi:MAG: serine/threonine protein kinase [Planctomycetia bacterium]|nr:serine/threonine protein kinase [Planctomycetia bacterium]